MRGPVLERGSPGFSAAAQVFNERFDYILPSAVARPLDAADVRGAVRWAIAHRVPLRARSGGHSYAGYSTVAAGVVLDLRYLRSISVDRRSGTATIGAGAQLIDVYAALAAHGMTLPAGSCPSVGIGGQAAELAEDQAGQPGREHGVARSRAPDRVQEFGPARGLQDVAGRAGLDRVEHVAMLAAGRQDQHPGARVTGLQSASDLDAGDVGQLEVEDDDVGAYGRGDPDRLSTFADGRDDLEAGLAEVAAH